MLLTWYGPVGTWFLWN